MSNLPAKFRLDRPPVNGGGGGSATLPSFAVGGIGDAPAVASPGSLQVFPWWYYPPRGSQYSYLDTGNLAIAAGVQNFALPGSSLRVNAGEKFVFVGVTLVTQTPTMADDFYFTLLRNGGPISGLDRLRNFSITANAAVRGFNGYNIQLEPGDTLGWTITNNGAAVTIGLSYLGWRTNLTDIERIDGGANY